ncbi:MAG: hypothetical protein NVSMB57_11900 [Actinomycetota bacterium]
MSLSATIPNGIQVIYTDLDGTMLGAKGAFTLDSAGEPTDEPARALAAAMRAGIEIVPVSGRAMPGIARDARLLGMRTAIGEMGAVVSYDSGSDVRANIEGYPGGEEPPVELMERIGAITLLSQAFPLELHMPWARARQYTALLRGLADVVQANHALEQAGFGWCELLDNGLLYGSYLGLAAGTSHVYHLTPRGVSKGRGIAFDRATRGLERARCIAIGDSAADLSMAEEVSTIVLTPDAFERDASLREAAAACSNVRIGARPGTLSWSDAVHAAAAGAAKG